MAERLGSGLQIRLQRFNSASHLHFEMIITWGFTLALPLLALGGGFALCPVAFTKLVNRFEESRIAAIVLTVVAWFWTAYECETIGIDVFDMLLKRFPGQVWLMAVVLSYLTIIWMPKNLPVRALTGLLMLMPAELFKVTRRLTPVSGFGAVHVFVVLAYLGAVVGMYGMFYPWRLEKAFAWVAARPVWLRVLGAQGVVWAFALVAAGFSLA